MKNNFKVGNYIKCIAKGKEGIYSDLIVDKWYKIERIYKNFDFTINGIRFGHSDSKFRSFYFDCYNVLEYNPDTYLSQEDY